MTRRACPGNRPVDASFDPAVARGHPDFARLGTVVFFAWPIAPVVLPVAFFPIWFLGFLGRSIGRRVWKITEILERSPDRPAFAALDGRRLRQASLAPLSARKRPMDNIANHSIVA